jgi:hypothetical protein
MPPPTDPQKLAAYNQKIIAERKSVSILEEQFSHPQKTILELEVVPGQKTKKTFEVKQIPGTPPI